jgi:HAAS
VTQDDYLRQVGYMLNDLPWSTRRDLLAELRRHLEELPADTDLRTQLGPPKQYAADLRSAAGLERRRGPVAFLRARRPRNLILTVLLLTAIGLTIGAVVWIDSYQPLTFGNAYRLPNGSVDAPAGGSASVVFHQGRPFELGLELLNTGRFAVRVLGVPYDGPYHVPLPYRARVRMFGPDRSGGGGPLRPFQPFDLKPGMRAYLELDGAYAHCRSWKGAWANILDDFPVRYRFLWKTATAEVPLPEKLAIVFKKQNSCH